MTKFSNYVGSSGRAVRGLQEGSDRCRPFFLHLFHLRFRVYPKQLFQESYSWSPFVATETLAGLLHLPRREATFDGWAARP